MLIEITKTIFFKYNTDRKIALFQNHLFVQVLAFNTCFDSISFTCYNETIKDKHCFFKKEATIEF